MILISFVKLLCQFVNKWIYLNLERETMFLEFNFNVDANMTALIVAIGSFVFTLYQWLINLNSRRPNLRLVRFQPAQVLLNYDYKDFILYIRTNFILVNLSDLPNSILDMKFYCNISGKWYEGKYSNSQDIFPLFVQGHSSEIADKGRNTFSVSFPIFPTLEEIKNAKVLVELYDQYDKVYKIKLDSKWVAKASKLQVPYFNKEEVELGQIPSGDSVYHIVYNTTGKTLGFYEFSRYGQGRGGSYFTFEVVKSKTAEMKEENRIFYTDVGQAKIYFAKTNGIVNTMEIEIEGKPTQKIELPKEFFN